jgi:UDP-glucose 4-epimerase
VKKYLITGGAGFIGSYIARRLIDAENEVWIVDNLSTGSQDNIPKEAHFLKADLSQKITYQRLPNEKFDAVFHLAAQSSGPISYYKPVYDLRANALATLLLLRWCYQKGLKRFLFASSMGVYGNLEKLPAKESDRCYPTSFYGITKLASEQYVQFYQHLGMDTTSFRMFNVYGLYQNMENLMQGMVSIYMAYILNGLPVLVKGSKDRFRDIIYIDDVVDVWIKALDNEKSLGKVYNLATGAKTYVWELIREEILAFGYDPSNYPVKYVEPTKGDQFGIYADISLVSNDLNWHPKVNLKSGLSRMVTWAKKLNSEG